MPWPNLNHGTGLDCVLGLCRRFETLFLMLTFNFKAASIIRLWWCDFVVEDCDVCCSLHIRRVLCGILAFSNEKLLLEMCHQLENVSETKETEKMTDRVPVYWSFKYIHTSIFISIFVYKADQLYLFLKIFSLEKTLNLGFLQGFLHFFREMTSLQMTIMAKLLQCPFWGNW